MSKEITEVILVDGIEYERKIKLVTVEFDNCLETRIDLHADQKGGKKFDTDKLDWTLLDDKMLEGVVKVLEYGAKKYSRENWKKVKNAKTRYKAALKRHLVEFYSKAKSIDDESRLYHIDHAICNLLFLRWFYRKDLK